MRSAPGKQDLSLDTQHSSKSPVCLSIAVPQHLGVWGTETRGFGTSATLTGKTKQRECLRGHGRELHSRKPSVSSALCPCAKGHPHSSHTVKGCILVSEDLSSVHNACVPTTAHRKQKPNNSYSGQHAYTFLYLTFIHVLKLLVPYCSLSDFNNNNFDIRDQLPVSCTVRGERDLATQRARGVFFLVVFFSQ